ncbi:Protein FAM162B [Habropoda laboriosa]|uniref:Protein FAM162B n=1 Tax=Habropoda laboriosa TaxID=597456 RepID=A0A0L7RK98_9HYME|nr:Protein FAM162B [Habropoda laboriosa]
MHKRNSILCTLGTPSYNVSNFNKRILVWVKRYPSIDQVPSQLPIEVIQQAHTKARIRVCFIMMIFSILGLLISAQIGKRDVASGKNIYTERTKWYNEIKEKANREKQEALNAGKE